MKKLVRNLWPLAVGVVLQSSSPLSAADGGPTYRHVLVIGDDPSATEAQRLAIADGFAGAIEHAVNLNVGRAIYGRRVGKGGDAPSPLSFVMRAVQDVNASLNEAFMTNATYEKYLIKQFESRAASDPWVHGFDIRKVPIYSRLANPFEQTLAGISQGTQRTLTYEILTLPASTELPDPDPASFIGKVKDTGINLTALMLQAARVGDAKEYAQILDLYDDVNGFTVVDAGMAQSRGLYKIARDSYTEATRDESKAWLPLYLAVSLKYGDQGIQPSIKVILRPGQGMNGPAGPRGASFDALPPKDKIMEKTVLDYSPQLSFGSDQPAAMSITASAAFGDADQQRSVVKLDWGRMDTADVRVITQCSTNCDADLAAGSIGRNYPTISGVFRFEFVDAIPANTSDKGFFTRVRNAVTSKINGAIQNGVGFAASASEHANFHLLVETMAIEIGTDVIRVVPSQSRFTLGVGDGSKSITVNPTNNVVAGVDLNVLGFDMYGKLNPEISAAFSAEINAQFKNGIMTNEKDFDSKQASLLKALEPITKALDKF